ncbi:triple functional domain protein-like [Copidosoma floridanum]|uniref:triple functional domain protein-like n=1 Tax=Copidosoma floridanum TaxID=29053 RepID=UPI0006C9E499|nr:triple functional domain protein-like [Copidosoma floridanum]
MQKFTVSLPLSVSEIIGSDGCGAANTSSPGNKRRGFSGRKWLPPPLRKLSQSKVDKSSERPPPPPPPPPPSSAKKSSGLDKLFKLPSSGSSDKAPGSLATPPGPGSKSAPSGTAAPRATSLASPAPRQTSDAEEPPAPGAVDSGAEDNGSGQQNGAEDAEDEQLELPPPMKPIAEPMLATGPPANSDDELPGKLLASEPGAMKPLDATAGTTTSADIAEIEQIVKERMEQHTEKRERNSSSVFQQQPQPAMSVDSPSASTPSPSGVANSAVSSQDAEESLPPPPPPPPLVGDDGPEATALAKRQFVIRELVDTERDYVNDLRQIIEGYMALMRNPATEIPLPEDLKGGKDKMVFGNIEAIYEWHRDCFLKSLEHCLERPEELGPLFKRYERKLHMYVVYCQNKPVSEYIVSEYSDTYFEELRQKLGHRLQLCDLLIKPVQRITKYQLLLREALRLTERTQRQSEIEGLRAAAHVMRVIPKAANDMMDVGRLQGFDGKITAQGKLLLHGPLMVAELSSLPSRGREWQVFLFEQNIIFSEAVGKKTQFTSPAYIYKAHIQVNKMSLEDSPEDPEKFIIRSTDPRKPGLGFACNCCPTSSDDTSSGSGSGSTTSANNLPRRQEWVDTITSILQTQRDFLKAIQSPIAYQKELTKDPLIKCFKGCQYCRGATPESTPSPRSLPPTNSKDRPEPAGSTSSSSCSSPARKQQPVHRSHTGGPLDPGVNDLPRTPSPTKSKLNFLEGFRNTLRARSPVRIGSVPVAPGARVRLTADWGALRAGDEIVVRGLENNGLVVTLVEHPKQEHWIPASLIPNSSVSRAWSFRPRKPNVDVKHEHHLGNNAMQHLGAGPNHSSGTGGRHPSSPPCVSGAPTPIKANSGEIARLAVQVSQAEGALVAWRREGQDRDIQENERYRLRQSAGFFYLEITRCRPADSGAYLCSVSCDNGSCSARIYLTVAGGTGMTWARVLDWEVDMGHGRIEVDWEPEEVGRCDVEYRSAPSANWTTALEDIESPPVVLELLPGASYSFRVVSRSNGSVTSASPIVNLPLGDATSWESEQFVARYLELDEIGKGRYAAVRRARDRGTGQEVALKQTPRQKQSRSLTRAEYELLASTHHGNIVRAFALFENSTLGVDTIVLELVRGPMLFQFLSKKTEYTEGMANKFANQLLSALQWLHQRNKAHLDLKPENVLVDQDTGIVKLIDFGEAVRGPVDEVVAPPADLEFAAPESVLGRPSGPYTDMWAVGVFIYVLLSGLSPFLDDSVEETTTNILKCDFCFPDEYFETISNEAKDLLSRLLCLRIEDRASAQISLSSPWFKVSKGATIPSTRMAAFTERRAHCSKSHRDHRNSFYS